MIYLKRENILEINFKLYQRYGGNFVPPFNLNNPDAFEYLVEMIENDDYYPTIHDKVSLYAYNINANHVFSDGNKRTSMFTALTFLEYNFYKLNDNISNQDLIDFPIKIAKGLISRDEVIHWFVKNTEEY